MRPIDADALLRRYKTESPFSIDGRARQIVEEMPTIEEPKKGKWSEVRGYATPGGDPVWACSECGKGIHVYGIEHGTYGSDIADHQWVACPNCGISMEGEEHEERD